MDFIVKLLFLSGKYLTRAAGRTIIGIISRSVTISKTISFKYERAVQVITPYNNMLELLNTHTPDVDKEASAPQDFRLIANVIPTAHPLNNTERVFFDNNYKFTDLMRTTLYNMENEFYFKNCSKFATQETAIETPQKKIRDETILTSTREKNKRKSKSETSIECGCKTNDATNLSLKSHSCIALYSPPHFIMNYNGLYQLALASSNLYYKVKLEEIQKSTLFADDIKYSPDLVKNKIVKLNACPQINSSTSPLLQDSNGYFSKSESNLSRMLKPIDSKRKLSQSSVMGDALSETMHERDMKFVRVSQRAFHKTERALTQILIKQSMQEDESKSDEDEEDRKKLLEVNQKAFEDFESDLKTVVLLDRNNNKLIEHKPKPKSSDSFKYEFINSFKQSLNAAALADSIKDRILMVLNKRPRGADKDATLSNIFKREVQDIRNRLSKQVTWLKLNEPKLIAPGEGDVKKRGDLLQTNDNESRRQNFDQKLLSANDTLQKLLSLEATEQENRSSDRPANWLKPPVENKCNFGFSRQCYHFKSNKISNCRNRSGEGNAISCNNKLVNVTKNPSDSNNNVDIVMICANVKNKSETDFAAALTQNESESKKVKRFAVHSEAGDDDDEISDLLRKVKFFYEGGGSYEEGTSKKEEEEEIAKCVAKDIDSIRLTEDDTRNSFSQSVESQQKKCSGNLQTKNKTEIATSAGPKQKNNAKGDNDDEKIENAHTQASVKNNLPVFEAKSSPEMARLEPMDLKRGRKEDRFKSDKLAKPVENKPQNSLDFKKPVRTEVVIPRQSTETQKKYKNLQAKNKSVNLKVNDDKEKIKTERIKHDLAVPEVKSVPETVRFEPVSLKQDRKGGKFKTDKAKPAEDGSQTLPDSEKSEALTYQKKYNYLQANRKTSAPNKLEQRSEAKPVRLEANKNLKQNQSKINNDDNRGKPHLLKKRFAFKPPDDHTHDDQTELKSKESTDLDLDANDVQGEDHKINCDAECSADANVGALKPSPGKPAGKFFKDLVIKEARSPTGKCSNLPEKKFKDIIDETQGGPTEKSKASSNDLPEKKFKDLIINETRGAPTGRSKANSSDLPEQKFKDHLKKVFEQNELGTCKTDDEVKVAPDTNATLLNNDNKLSKFGDIVAGGEIKNSRGRKQDEEGIEASEKESDCDGVQKKICWTTPASQNDQSENQNDFSIREIANLIKRVVTKRIGPRPDDDKRNENKNEVLNTSSDLTANNDSAEASDSKISEQHKILVEKIDDIINEYCSTYGEDKTRDNRSSKKYCKTIFARSTNSDNDIKSQSSDYLSADAYADDNVLSNEGKEEDLIKPDAEDEMNTSQLHTHKDTDDIASEAESKSETPVNESKVVSRSPQSSLQDAEDVQTKLFRSAIAKGSSTPSPKMQQQEKAANASLIKSGKPKLTSSLAIQEYVDEKLDQTSAYTTANKFSKPNIDIRFEKNEAVPHTGKHSQNKNEFYPRTLASNNPFGPTTSKKRIAKRDHKFESDESSASHRFKKVNALGNKFSFDAVTDTELLTPLAATGNDETESQRESTFYSESARGNLSSDSSSYVTANTHVPPSSSDETGNLIYMRRKKDTTRLINELYKRSMRYAVKRNDRLWLAEQQMKKIQRRKNNIDSPHVDDQRGTKHETRSACASIYERFPFLNKYRKTITNKSKVNVLNKEVIDNIMKHTQNGSQFRKYKELNIAKTTSGQKNTTELLNNTKVQSVQQKSAELFNNRDRSAKEKPTKSLSARQKSTVSLNNKDQSVKQLEEPQIAEDIYKKYPLLKKTRRINKVKRKIINQDQITERLLNLSRKYSSSRQINKSAVPSGTSKEIINDYCITNKPKQNEQQKNPNCNIKNARCSGLKQCYTPQSHALNQCDVHIYKLKTKI